MSEKAEAENNEARPQKARKVAPAEKAGKKEVEEEKEEKEEKELEKEKEEKEVEKEKVDPGNLNAEEAEEYWEEMRQKYMLAKKADKSVWGWDAEMSVQAKLKKADEEGKDYLDMLLEEWD